MSDKYDIASMYGEWLEGYTQEQAVSVYISDEIPVVTCIVYMNEAKSPKYKYVIISDSVFAISDEGRLYDLIKSGEFATTVKDILTNVRFPEARP